MIEEAYRELARTERDAPGEVCSSALLEQMAELPLGMSVTLASGRRYEAEAAADGDRLTIRGRTGRVVLQIVVTDRGPLLSFESADIEVAGARRLALSADDVAIEARRSMQVRVDGDSTETIGGARHTKVGGPDRLEAQSVQMQANQDAIEMRALGRIGLDGEHIGLNDDPCPQPFTWSAIASVPEEGV